MEGLFAWIVIAGAIYSLINKAVKNPQKPGTGKFIPPDLSAGIMSKRTMLEQMEDGEGTSSKEMKFNEGLAEKEGLADYEGSSFGDDISVYEGTSFGDDIKGTEGESAEGRGQIVLQQEDASIIPVDQENKWNFNSENLMSAFVYAEILSQPRCRRNKIR